MAIGIEVYAWLNEKRIRKDTNSLADNLERDAAKMGQRFGDSLDRGITASSAKAGKSLQAVTKATESASKAQEKYNAALQSGDTDRITRATDKYAMALGRQADAQRNAAGTLRNLNNEMSNAGSAGKQLNNIIQDIGTTAMKTGRGLTTIGAPVAVAGLLELAKVGIAATQSLWLLPAAAAAGGAAMGTLTLATSGFMETIKDIRDPEKFAESINKISPAAQQAALTVRNLLPEFDALKAATEESFFDGMGAQIQRLTTQYLPGVQGLTTSIASSFNAMMTGVSNQLMTPDTQAAMQRTFDNISLAFQNAAPAAQSFAQAIGDIISVGSQSLPGMGQGIADMAANFASFIREAAESGKLSQWIQQGTDAVIALSTFVWDLGQLIYRIFGPDAGASIDEFNNKLSTISEILGLVTLDTKTWSESWKQEMDAMGVANDDMIGDLGGIRDAIMDIPEAFAWVVNKGVDMANGIKHVLDEMSRNFTNFMNLLPGEDKVFTPLPDIPRIDTGWANDWGGHQLPSAVDQPFGPGNAGQQQHERRGTTPPQPLGDPGAPWLGPRPVPGAPPGGFGASDREQRDAIIAGLPESAYKIDPYSGLPAGMGPVNGVPGANGKIATGGIRQGYNEFGQPVGPGGNVVDPQKIDDADWRVQDTAHSLEEARKDRLALEASNNASAEQISDAKWKELEAERNWRKAQRELIDAQNGTFKELENSSRGLADGMGQIGVALDKDLGISKGLSGLADNLVRFLGNLAFAPMLGKLEAIKAANPSQGGYGLLGIMGAQGAFGPDFTGIDTGATTGGATSPSAYSPVSSGAGTGPLPGPAMMAQPGQSPRDFAHEMMMPFWESQGLKVGDHAADRHGEHQNGALDIMVPDIATGRQVLQQVLSDPNVYGAIFDNQAYGYGQGPGARPYSGGNTGNPTQDHKDHVHAWYKPGGQDNINPDGTPMAMPGMTGAPGASTSFAGGNIPLPLPVTIVGGAVAASGGGGGSPGPAPSSVGPSGPSVSAAMNGAGSGLNWDALAQAEAGGDWANASNPKYKGGLQFDQPTWDASKLPGMPARADLATREQQIAAAENAISQGRTPSSLWPQNHGLLTSPAANATTGGSTSAPSPTPGGILAGLPPGIGGGGESAMFPGAAGPAAPKQYGGVAPAAHNAGGGGLGIASGGTLDMALQAGAMGLDVLAPGAGQAASTGIKLASRAIQQAGQVAGIGVQGLMETFLPTGASELANNSWFTRIAGSFAAMAPALPNIAGGAKGKEGGVEPPLSPADVLQQQASAKGGTNIEKLEYNNNGATEDRAGKDLTYHLERSAAPPGPR